MKSKRLGQLGAALAALIAFGIYWDTLARTVTWMHNGADGGELVAAAFVGGFPHPPGYPLYTLIAAVFARIPGIEPAQGVAIFSALMASAAVFVLSRAGTALLESSGGSEFASGDRPAAPNSKVSVLIPPLAALAFAFSPMFWSQAIIPEVYALNAFLGALILWACLSNSGRRVYVAALALGLGLAHHLSILLLVPGALIALRPTLRDWRALLLVIVPLAFYAYLPLAALPNPPVKWGDTTTREGLLWIVTAELYRPYLFALNSANALSRFAYSARALLEQFTLVGIALVIWGALQLALARRRLFLATLLMFVLVVGYAIIYASRDSFLYLLPAFEIALIWMVYGVGAVLAWAGRDRLLSTAGIVLFVLLPVYNLAANYARMDVSLDRAAYLYAKQIYDVLPADAVLFADGDEALFALLYYRHTVAYQGNRSVIVSQGLLQYGWYYDILWRTMSEVEFKPPTEVTDAHQRAREIIRVTFAEGRAVCFTDSSPLLPEFEYEERGVLKCVYAEKNP